MAQDITGASRTGNSVASGARLDRLPISRFHWKMLGLIGAGMFLDAFDIYLAGGVLGALVKSGWSTLELNALFVSATFVGMTIGAWSAGVLGDRYGRRFTYQANLALFGLASLAAAFAPNMSVLIALRFIMGIGLGAEIVVGYATLTEFVPARSRGRWIALLAIITNTALFASSLVGLWVIPAFGWQYMFGIVGVLAMVIWALRKSMPESPRWLEAQGRLDEAEAILGRIEAETAVGRSLPRLDLGGPAAPGASSAGHGSILDLFSPGLLRQTLLGSLLHVVVGFSLYGFINWLPTFFVKSGYSVVASLQYTTLMALGGPAGAFIGWLLADSAGRKPTIVGSSLAAIGFGIAYPLVGDGPALLAVGFGLVTAIYVMLTAGFAMHVPELFPTKYRLRGTAVCATAGRLVTAVVQFVVIAVFAWGGLPGVLAILIGLLLFQAVMIALYGIETRQQALEDIAAPERRQPGPAPVAGRAAKGAAS
ncbi:MAG: MFS transporter [Rhizobiales bacterium]|nr:MFS transporter [Hyphomicrobiales bacterium]